MPAQVAKVTPPALLQAAETAAAAAEQAAAPHPAAIPHATPGSAADGAWAALATAMGARQADLSARVVDKGPAIEAATQSGVTQLQAADEQNAAAIGAVGDSAGEGLSAAAGAPGGAGAGAVQAVSFGGVKESLGDGWDNETEDELEVPHGWVQDWTGKWSPPVAHPGGAAGGSGLGRAPI
jgi:hypothetical protein